MQHNTNSFWFVIEVPAQGLVRCQPPLQEQVLAGKVAKEGITAQELPAH